MGGGVFQRGPSPIGSGYAALFPRKRRGENGKACGERFTVIVSDAKSHRVYVSARGAGGQEIALNIAAEALELVQPQPEVAPTANIPAVMAMRFGGCHVTAVERSWKTAANPEGEEAVIRGLQFLVKTQNPDGTWGKGLKPYVAAMTGFSVLSFLGQCGETPDSPQFGATVKSAVHHWIVEQGQQSDGRLSMEAAFSQPGVYAHAIATFCARGILLG